MLELLEKYYKENRIVNFYLNKDDNTKNLTGYIHAFNENELLISHISSRGLYDGFILNKMDELYMVSSDDYSKKIETLYKLKNQSHPVFNCEEDDILGSLLDYAIDNKYVITLDLLNDRISGFVNKYNDNYIYLDMINEYGKKTGKCVIDCDEVVTIACDSDDEQDLKMLFTY